MSYPRRNEDRASGFALAVAGIAPIAVAGALVPFREELVTANLALLLVVVVVLAAVVGGRAAGALAALISALSFDFFLTRPYLSLTIDSADDIETTVILLVIGLIVGQVVVSTRRARRAAARGADEVARLHRVAGLAARGTQSEEMLAAVREELTGLLDLRSCMFEPSPTGVPLPRLERTGVISGERLHRFVSGEFALPEEGVELPVLARGRQVGRLVLEPESGHGASLEERIVAVAIADQLGAALAAGEGSSRSGTSGNGAPAS
jgi:hypothetical protein